MPPPPTADSGFTATPYFKKAGDVPLPGYTLLEPLGRGGFGEVWKCEAPGGLHKAIKFVGSDPDAPAGGSHQLRQEFDAFQQIKTIRHPFLLMLERVELHGDELVMVMELADEQLQDRFRAATAQGRPGIPRDELLGYLADAAEALDIIGAKYGLQHLDIKPANLFIISGHVKVGDYGLVCRLEGATQSSGNRGLTPRYVAPEVLRGQVHTRSDQYSLALVYQELLTGTFAYSARSPQQMMLQHVNAVPDVSSLPPGDQPIIAKALSKKPEDRHPSCMAFIRALILAVNQDLMARQARMDRTHAELFLPPDPSQATGRHQMSDTTGRYAPPSDVYPPGAMTPQPVGDATAPYGPLPPGGYGGPPTSRYQPPQPPPPPPGTYAPGSGPPPADPSSLTGRHRSPVENGGYSPPGTYSRDGDSSLTGRHRSPVDPNAPTARGQHNTVNMTLTGLPSLTSPGRPLPPLISGNRRPGAPLPPPAPPQQPNGYRQAGPLDDDQEPEASPMVRLDPIRSVVPVAALVGQFAGGASQTPQEFIDALIAAAAGGGHTPQMPGDIGRLADGTWVCQFPSTVPAAVVPHKVGVVREQWGLTPESAESGKVVLRKYAAGGLWGSLSGKKAGLEVAIRLPQAGRSVGEVTVMGSLFGGPDAAFVRSALDVLPRIVGDIRRELQNVEDRRKHPRIAAGFPVTLYPIHPDGSVDNPIPAKTRDVSAGGLCLTPSYQIPTKYLYVVFDGVAPLAGLAILLRLVRLQQSSRENVAGGQFRTDL